MCALLFHMTFHWSLFPVDFLLPSSPPYLLSSNSGIFHHPRLLDADNCDVKPASQVSLEPRLDGCRRLDEDWREDERQRFCLREWMLIGGWMIGGWLTAGCVVD